MLVGQDAVVVRTSTPEHRRVRHQAFFAGLDHRQMARTTGLARYAQVAGIDEADEFGRFLEHPGIAALWVGARWPLVRIARQHMSLVDRVLIA